MSDCMAGRRSEAPRPPMIAQKMMIAARFSARVIASAPIAYASRPNTYALLRPKRSPSLLLIRMNAAETRASLDYRRDRHVHQRRVDDQHEHRGRQQERQPRVPRFLGV